MKTSMITGGLIGAGAGYGIGMITGKGQGWLTIILAGAGVWIGHSMASSEAIAESKKKVVVEDDASKSGFSSIGHYCCPEGYELRGSLCKNGLGGTVLPQVCSGAKSGSLKTKKMWAKMFGGDDFSKVNTTLNSVHA